METAVATGFAGKTALITGAGRGLGRAIALGLADAGAGLILLARSAGQPDETRAAAGQGPPRAPRPSQ
jgi:NAD(P)-dependent dehydrogenase (short-subunit alcohol dehydrogenase family)